MDAPSLPPWPPVIRGDVAVAAALAFRARFSQWWTSERLRASQDAKLRELLIHAARHSPFHRKRLADAGFDARQPDLACWDRIPVLTRAELQAHAARIHANVVPPSHGAIQENATGGSTGVPVRVRRTALDGIMAWANQLREEDWHRGDPLGVLAQLRDYPPTFGPAERERMATGDGIEMPTHPIPQGALMETGPGHVFLYTRPLDEQVAFLLRVRPATITTLPTNLRLLLHHLRDRGVALRGVDAVWTSSEVVDPPLRALCREVLGCRIVSNYSAHEVGCIALQCPDHEHLHVCSETIRVEVLNDDGHVCEPGQVGRVVVTPLDAFATPLLRYELGDRAEVGVTCPCGRGLPVLTQIVGRMYDALVMRDGSRRYMGINYGLAKIEPVREYQLVQSEPGKVEVRLVLARPLTSAEADAATASIAARTGPDVEIRLSPCERLARTPAGKLRPFVSLS